MKVDHKIINTSILRANLKNLPVSLLVGVLICVVRSVFVKKMMPPRDMLLTVMFSVVITMSITSSLYLYERFLRPQRVSLWVFIVAYYACNLLGMLIGVEVSYMLVSVIFRTPYVPLQHFADYRFTFVIVLIVGTILYLLNAQRSQMRARLQEKELDLARIKNLKTQAELQTLQSKINPHFLYNSLNSIASLIHEDADKAEDMTLKLSKLFRYSINSQQENMATVKDEMEIVNTYLDIEKVRFGDRIEFSSNIDPALSHTMMPRFLIQPLVENALKHGLNNVAQDGKLSIDLYRKGQRIMIEVADNGRPFPAELDMGYGLQSTYDKLQLLYGDDQEMQLNNEPHKHILISLPLS